jgi:hypothetical protein
MSEQRDAKQEGWTGEHRKLTYYDVLDLDRDASPEEIKTAYYELARQHHPDVASQDPEIAQKFAIISEAYRVLSDPQRRYQYDRTLPRKSYPLRHPTPEKIWREATDVVLIRSDRFGPLNQAMQATVPIVLDEDTLVVTMPGSERHLAGHMETASNRNAILNALELVYGRRIDFRVIDGTTLEDWQNLKEAEARTRRAAEAAMGSQDQETAAPPEARPGLGEGPWDELIQRIHRRYQQLPKRQYPQSKARYLREALGWIARMDEDLRYSSAGGEDAHERALARAIERLAAILDLSPVLVALELDAMKRAGEV